MMIDADAIWFDRQSMLYDDQTQKALSDLKAKKDNPKKPDSKDDQGEIDVDEKLLKARYL